MEIGETVLNAERTKNVPFGHIEAPINPRSNRHLHSANFKRFLLTFLIITAIIIIVFNDISNSMVADGQGGPQNLF